MKLLKQREERRRPIEEIAQHPQKHTLQVGHLDSVSTVKGAKEEIQNTRFQRR